MRYALQVQFYQDRPQLFAKMSKPHSFGYLLYRTNGSAVQAAEAQPVQLWNTTADSHYAAERLPQLQALRAQAVGHATAAGELLNVVLHCMNTAHRSACCYRLRFEPVVVAKANTFMLIPDLRTCCRHVGVSAAY